MKAAFILSFAAAAMAGVLEPRGCAQDNCYRAILGTAAHLTASEVRQSDCSAFQATTVVPDAVTATVTVTVDGDTPHRLRRDAGIQERGETKVPTALPAYATHCSVSSRYASACSCWGITASVTTAPTPTSTTTVTVTQDYCEDL